MQFHRQNSLSNSEKKGLLLLWNSEYPIQLAYPTFEQFEDYLSGLENPSHILLKTEEEKIIGWYFDFIREDEKWFAIILNSNIHGQGMGTQLINHLKQQEPQLIGWVIDHNNNVKANGKTYMSPLNFYLKNGFITVPSKRLELDKISAVRIEWKRKVKK